MENLEAIPIVTVHTAHQPLFTYEQNKKFLLLDEDQNYMADEFTDVQVPLSPDNRTPDDRAGWRTPVQQMRSPPSLRITTSDAHIPKRPDRGFVFGSNAAKCDIILGNGDDDGVSGKQFAITWNWDTGVLLIHNYSSHGTHIQSHQMGNTKLARTRILPIGEDLRIYMQSFIIFIRCPDPRRTWNEGWKVYCNKMFLRAQVIEGLEDLEDLNVQSTLRTSKNSQNSKTPGAKKYLISREIGQGAFGVVYEAIDINNGDIFAAKQSIVADSFRKEEKALQLISHDNIVKFHHVWEKEGGKSPMLIMELVEGGDLGNAIAAHRLTITELREGLRQMLEAMAYVHNQGVTHRDIKPANILVKSRSPLHLKLTDFGLASVSKELQTKCGSPLYTAPEIHYEGRYSNKVDIWSVGVVALECSYGFPDYNYDIFDMSNWPDALQRHLSSLEPNLTVQFISSLLQANPNSRPSASQCLQHAFFTTPPPPATTQDQLVSVSLEETVDKQTRPNTPLREDSAKTTVVPADLVDVGPWDTQILASSRNPPTEHSDAGQHSQGTSSDGHDKTASPVRRITSSSGNEVSHSGSNDDEESTILYYHEDPLRDPLVVGSEIEKIARETEAAAAARPVATNPSVIEYGSSQLPAYDYAAQSRPSRHSTTQASSLAGPDNTSRLDHDGNTELGDQDEPSLTTPSANATLAHPTTAESSTIQYLGSNIGERHIGSQSAGLNITDSFCRQWESVSSICSSLQEYFNRIDQNRDVLDGSSKHLTECQGDGIAAADAHPPEASEHLSTQLSMHNPGGSRHVLIENQRVSLRISDNSLNASEICIAAGLDQRTYRALLGSLKDVDSDGVWVPFADGVALGRDLNLPNLEQLFSTTSQPSQGAVRTNSERVDSARRLVASDQGDGARQDRRIRLHERTALRDLPNTNSRAERAMRDSASRRESHDSSDSWQRKRKYDHTL
ncbi:hypothetical protein F5Y10DRAFT_267752 [Nemania abortiva]|nr:hypothetical protein F5Y10DRAFT_267752 [Nemania abortiva]